MELTNPRTRVIEEVEPTAENLREYLPVDESGTIKNLFDLALSLDFEPLKAFAYAGEMYFGYVTDLTREVKRAAKANE